MSDAPAKIELNDVELSYGRLKVLDRINLKVSEGEFVAIVGPSGCGKSSLLRLLAGLERPDAGTVLVDEQEVRAPTPQRMLILQEHGLFPWRTVQDNIALGLEIRRTDKREINARVTQAMAMVGLEPFKSYYPHQLSGGMRQRASIARSLVLDPAILLMDEPYGALDALTRLSLQHDLVKLWQHSAKTVVLITHDVHEAVYLADRVLVMSARPGRFEAEYLISHPHPRPRETAEQSEIKASILADLGVGVAR